MRYRDICCLIGSILIGLAATATAQPTVDGVQFSTIPPGCPYETLGIVTDIQHIPPAILDLTKPFREVLRRLYPELARQAKVVGGNGVVLTNFEFIPGPDRDHYLQVYGTAVRLEPGSAVSSGAPAGGGAVTQSGAAVQSGAAAQSDAVETSSPPSLTTTRTEAGGASPTSADSSDLSGKWYGMIRKEGDSKMIPLTVTLSSLGNGTYSGGVDAPSKRCDMLITYIETSNDTMLFKTYGEKGVHCIMWSGQTGKLTADGKLEWQIYTTDRDNPTYTGVLSR